jgi:prepilin-type N-terminal cleavage/methylation domain-containing protein
MSQKMRSQAGYSLTEMLVVVAIIGMLALVMVPNFVGFYQSNKMKASMRNFTTDLRSARQLAISQGKQTLLTYGTCATANNCVTKYDIWIGDKPYNSQNWTPSTGLNSNPPRPSKTLDNIVYFPTSTTLQTFTDFLNCSSGTNCTGSVANPANDGRIDIVFSPDGTALLPVNLQSGTITIKTDLNKLPKSTYTITISPSGRVLAQ